MTDLISSFKPKTGRQLLQRVITDSGPLEVGPLYLRHRTGDLPGSFSTDTYMNIFHKSRWSHLTGLKDFALEISIPASGTVNLYSLNNGQEPVLHLSRHLEPNAISISLPLDYEGSFFFFKWLPDESNDLPLMAGYTAESRQACQAVKIAMGVTTFERNEDLRRLVATYRQARLNIPEVKQLSHMFIINNQIKDAPLLSDLDGDGITVVNNPHNTGGAGGFSLAARMAVEAKEEAFTHVLFMDDDITIDTETWFRTFSLLHNLKPQYVGQVICGGMLQKENPARCHTLFEAIDQRAKHRNVSGSHDLVDLKKIAEILEKEDVDWGTYPGLTELPRSGSGLRPYAAWWYCVLPLSVFHEHGFPLPIFFRGDDIELGLRISRKVLWLNGICVWHPSFESKSSPLRTYLGFRNHIIFCLLHFKSGYSMVLKKYVRRLARSLAVNDYERAAITIMCLEDGLNIFQHPWDGPETMARVNGSLTSHPNKITTTANRQTDCPPLKAKTGKVTSLPYLCLVLLTLGGALIPGFLFREKTHAGSYAYVRGHFPTRCAHYTPGHLPTADTIALEFDRSAAFRLSLQGLKKLFCFIISGRKSIDKMKQGARSSADWK